MQDEPSRFTVPLVEERPVIRKRAKETGRVRIRTVVDEREQWVGEDLVHEEAVIERVPVNRIVEQLPEVRREGDVLVIPVVEERLIVEKQLVLKEEIHVRRERRLERFEQPITLRSTHAVVERTAGAEQESGTTPQGERST